MYLLTAPTVEPVSVSDAKLALHIDDDRYDDVLPSKIAAAREEAEHEAGWRFVQQTWRIELKEWPAADFEIYIYRPTACAITYWDGSAWVSLSGSAFAFAPSIGSGNRTILAPALGTSWPSLGDIAAGARVRIDLTTGVAPEDAATLPKCIREYMIDAIGEALGSRPHNEYRARKLDPVRVH